MANRKRCCRCLKLRPLDQFKRLASGRSHSYCEPCRLAYFRDYNKKRYASPQARAAELRHAHQRYATVIRPHRIEMKIRLVRLMGGKCSRCGYRRNAAAIDFDHVDQGRKRRLVGTLLHQKNGWDAALQESKRCQLLCANCHREKTYPDYAMPGSISRRRSGAVHPSPR